MVLIKLSKRQRQQASRFIAEKTQIDMSVLNDAGNTQNSPRHPK
jgi:hypothetical protein